MRDFFISFTKANRSWAEWIAWTLEEEKYSVWYQHWDFGVGSNFVSKMDEALKQSKQLIAVLSANYFEGEFTYSEWTSVFATDPKGEKRKIIPLRIENFDPPGLFSAIAYEDLFGLCEPDAKTALLHAILPPGKPATKPMFPGASVSSPHERVAPDTKPFPGPPPVDVEEADPATGSIVAHSCNRTKQQEIFVDAFLNSVRDAPQYPQLFVIHGRARERHVSLVNRFSETIIQDFADLKAEKRISVGRWENMKWSYREDVKAAKQELLEGLIREARKKDKAFLFTKHHYTVELFREALKPPPNPVIVIQYKIDADKRSSLSQETINAYLKLWDEIRKDAEIPDFIIFLNVFYPAVPDGGSWRVWNTVSNWFTRWRVTSRLTGITVPGRLSTALVDGYFCRYTLLGELKCVQLKHVQQWFEDHKLGHNEVAWETQSRNIFKKRGWSLTACKNMADVEDALEEFIDVMKVSSNSPSRMRTV